MKKSKFLFDIPFTNDWLFWLFIVFVIANVIPAFNRVTQNGGVNTSSFSLVSGAIDASLAIFISYLLITPIYGIRLYFRKSNFEPQVKISNSEDFYLPNLDMSNGRNNFNIRESQNSNEEQMKSPFKICDKCKVQVPMFNSVCPKCSGTSFTHINSNTSSLEDWTLSSEEARAEAIRMAADIYIEAKLTPDSKTCPMCAEEIKYAAKKCRYCQHMLDA